MTRDLSWSKRSNCSLTFYWNILWASPMNRTKSVTRCSCESSSGTLVFMYSIKTVTQFHCSDKSIHHLHFSYNSKCLKTWIKITFWTLWFMMYNWTNNDTCKFNRQLSSFKFSFTLSLSGVLTFQSSRYEYQKTEKYRFYISITYHIMTSD